MKYFKIKSEKQTNGLWGIPMNIIELKRGGFVKGFDELKFSAILIGLGEKYFDAKLSVGAFDTSNNKLFKVNILHNKIELNDSTKIIRISDYGLIGNTLYYMETDEDKKMFNRINKLKKLKTKINI